MFPIMGAIKWNRTYFAMLATPLRVGDVLAGHLVWIATRVATAVAAYLVVMAAFGTTPSFESLAVLPAGVLAGMAFADPTGRLRGQPGKRGGLPPGVPARGDPALPLLRRVLPRQPAACGPAGRRLRHPPLARGGPVPAA